MHILTSSYTLDLAGVPTFTLTMYRELLERGHKVTVYCPMGGSLERQMNVVSDLNELSTPDVILAQHTPCAIALRDIFPDTPLLFYSHSIWIEIDQPPAFLADGYLAINEAVMENLINQGVPKSKITIVRDFVDTARFTPTQPIHSKLEHVLFISNYKKWKNYFVVNGTCKKLGLNLKCCGSPYGRCRSIHETINEADLVISWGRGILEAMACGRAVVSFDKLMGDGYLTPTAYYESRKDNFCGYLSKRTLTKDDLVGELLKYDPGCFKVNRDLILKYHDVKDGMDQILEIIKKIC